MEIKNYSLATKYEVDDSFDSDKFIKLRVYVCHDGKNPNRSHFSLDAIEKAKPTISNIPILAHVIKDEDGTYNFGGHDMEVISDPMNEGEYRVEYSEIPVGVIMESNNYAIEEIDGRNYVVVDSYIWKGYGNLAPDIIERDQKIKISMEVAVNEYEPLAEDPIYFDVLDYKYLAVTLLNSSFGTGMINANAKVQEFNLDEGKEKFLQFTSELEKVLNIKEEEVIPEKFELTMREKLEKLQDGIENESTVGVDGEIVSEKYYWVHDVSDEFVYFTEYEYIRSEGESSKDFRAKYNAETFITDKSTKEEVFNKYLTQEEIDLVDSNRKKFEQEIADLKTELEKLSNENAILSDFKIDIETQIRENEIKAHNAEVDLKMSEFEDEIGSTEEYKALKVSAYSMEIDSVEKECLFIVGKNKHKAPKAPKPIVKAPVSFVSMTHSKPEQKSNVTYGEYDKYLIKDNDGGNNNG